MAVDIADLREKLAVATPGPWQWWNLEGVDQGWTDNGPNLETVARGPQYSDGSQGAAQTVISAWGHDAWGIGVEAQDAALIVAAVNALPALLDEVERLRGVVESVRAFATKERDSIRGRYGASAATYAGYANACDDVLGILAGMNPYPDARAGDTEKGTN